MIKGRGRTDDVTVFHSLASRWRAGGVAPERRYFAARKSIVVATRRAMIVKPSFDWLVRTCNASLGLAAAAGTRCSFCRCVSGSAVLATALGWKAFLLHPSFLATFARTLSRPGVGGSTKITIKNEAERPSETRFPHSSHPRLSALWSYHVTPPQSEKWKSLSRVRLFVTPWNSPGQNTGVGILFLLQGIFPAQGSNPGLRHCKQILYQLSPQSPWKSW